MRIKYTKDNLVEEIRGINKSIDESASYFKYKYDEFGNVIERTYKFGNEKTEYKHEFRYNLNNNMVDFKEEINKL